MQATAIAAPRLKKEKLSLLSIGHVGNAMMVIADTYHRLEEVLLEQVQNGIDANAKCIWVTLNHKQRSVIVRDNGDGVGEREFDQALQSVLETQKQGDKLGQFGRGLISPLGKCEQFTFTSRPRDAAALGYRVWTFVSDDIAKSREEIGIPNYLRKNITDENHPQRGVPIVPWNTEIFIHKYTADARIGRVNCEQLANAILDRFRKPMLDRGVTVKISFFDTDGAEEKRIVEASPFEGEEIPEIRFGCEEDGFAIFRLFQAPKKAKGRSGKILIGVESDLYRFPADLLRQDDASRQLIGREILDALTSGIFCGEILATKCTLHASRKHFVDNGFLLNFAVALELWHDEVGKIYLRKVQESREDERYQALGLEVLSNLKDLLVSDDCPPQLRDVFKQFEVGTTGSHHANVPKKKILGPTEQPLASVDGGTLNEERTPGGGKGRVFEQTKTERPDHTPLLAAGPCGRRRTLVKGNSIGLTIAHEEMPGSDRLWELDTHLGVLAFNIRHPHWQACESNDKWLVNLQEFIAVQALTLHSVAPRDDRKDEYRIVLDELVTPWVSLMVRKKR